MDGLFFSRLYSADGSFTYAGVDTWFRDDSPLQFEVFYIPTNISRQHWTGLIVNTITHHICYYDSLGDVNYSKRALYYLRQWMKCELLRLGQTGALGPARISSLGDPDLWTYHVNPPPSPSQSNTYDCGVFYLTTILYHIQGRLPNYTSTQITTIRHQLVIALLTSTIPYPFTPLAIYDSPLNSVHINYSAFPLLLSLSPPTLALPSSPSEPIIEVTIDQDDFEYYSIHVTGGGLQTSPPTSSSSQFLPPILEYALYHPP